jgi:membrane protease YdiL (CAAX protease family)
VTDPADPRPIAGRSDWLRLLVGLGLVFALFQWCAFALGSNRGESGLLVGTVVVVALVAAQRLLFGAPPPLALRSLGLGPPRWQGLFLAAATVALLLLVIPVFARVARADVALLPDWPWLLPGLFAQGGVAEETLFRGYLFGRLRVGRSFWRAAALSTVPFVAVHLFLFGTMPWPIAAAAIMLSVALAAPLAHLFEVGGRTVWAPALLHFIVQGTVKILVFTGGGGATFPLWWMAASAVLPWGVFVYSRPAADQC